VARGLGIPVTELFDSFRVAGPADLGAILKLRATSLGYLPAWNDARYLSWRYGLDPGQQSFATYRILELKGKVIAGIGAEEFHLQTAAGSLEAACLMDILALEECRGVGLGAWLNLALFRNYPLVFALSSNSFSMSTVKAVYSPLESRRELQFPLDATEFMRRKLPVPLLRDVAGFAATALLRLRSHRLRHRSSVPSGTLQEISRFAADTSFTQAHPPAEGVMEIVRSSAYLNWRYFDNPRAKYRVLGWFDGTQLLSHVVYGVGKDSSGTPLHCIVDWWMKDESQPAAFHALVAEVVQRAIAGGSPMVKALACGQKLQGQLGAAGFSRNLADGLAAGWHGRDGEVLRVEPREGRVCFTGLGEDMDVLG
jgi:hypothetical protein